MNEASITQGRYAIEDDADNTVTGYGPNVVAPEHRFTRILLLLRAWLNPLVILLVVLAVISFATAETTSDLVSKNEPSKSRSLLELIDFQASCRFNSVKSATSRSTNKSTYHLGDLRTVSLSAVAAAIDLPAMTRRFGFDNSTLLRIARPRPRFHDFRYREMDNKSLNVEFVTGSLRKP